MRILVGDELLDLAEVHQRTRRVLDGRHAAELGLPGRANHLPAQLGRISDRIVHIGHAQVHGPHPRHLQRGGIPQADHRRAVELAGGIAEVIGPRSLDIPTRQLVVELQGRFPVLSHHQLKPHRGSGLARGDQSMFIRRVAQANRRARRVDEHSHVAPLPQILRLQHGLRPRLHGFVVRLLHVRGVQQYSPHGLVPLRNLRDARYWHALLLRHGVAVGQGFELPAQQLAVELLRLRRIGTGQIQPYGHSGLGDHRGHVSSTALSCVLVGG